MAIEEKLKSILMEAKPWERIKTNIDGVFIIKIPATKNKPETLAIELHPTEEGKLTKKRGYFIFTKGELEKLKEIINNPKLDELLTTVDKISVKEEKVEKIIEV